MIQAFWFVALAAARQWWGEQHGVDVSETGLANLPQMPVLTSGFVHASTRKVLALQGIGRGNLQVFSGDEFGRLDLAAMRAALQRAGIAANDWFFGMNDSGHVVRPLLLGMLGALPPGVTGPAVQDRNACGGGKR